MLNALLHCPAANSRWFFVITVTVCWLPRWAWPQVPYDLAPIDYLNAPVHDAVAELQVRLDAKAEELRYDPRGGFLPDLLAKLHISPSSQVLVFSRTSFQPNRISPRRPRAIYFNDHTYVGWVQRGDVIEISSVDAQQGAVFYALDQEASDTPRFLRQTDNCLVCHASSHTEGVPGHFVRSVYPDGMGRPLLRAGTFRTDYRSPFSQRWGGWYVSGTHGQQRHMGNVTVQDESEPETLDVERGANVTDLSRLGLDMQPYLTPHSDIVALMVLEHQVAMHNALTAANYSARITMRDAKVMNEALGRDADYESDSTRRRLDAAAEKVVQMLLMSEEHPLTDPIAGTSGFAEHFERQGPFDTRQRSLRNLDLRTRLFDFPCSYLIYSDAFNALPEPVLSRVWKRLWDVLTGAEALPPFRRLTAGQRRAILEILRDTKSHLPDYWLESQTPPGP